METKDGGRQACASCKHQRKKCSPNCILAPFFPANKRNKFLAVHRVFGVSNVQKLIKSLDTIQKQRRAVESMTWEAECRLREPVEGCFGEYRKVCNELKDFRTHVSNCMNCNDRIRMQRGVGHGNRDINVGIRPDHDVNRYLNHNKNLMQQPPPYDPYIQQWNRENYQRHNLPTDYQNHFIGGFNQHHYFNGNAWPIPQGPV